MLLSSVPKYFAIGMLFAAAMVFATAPSAARATLAEATEAQLTEEVARLASRSAWIGVERTVEKFHALTIPMDRQTLIFAAHAARDLGHAQSCRDRLHAALTAEPSRDLVDWLWDLDTRYGKARLVLARPSVDLHADWVPFDPAQKRAIEHASATLENIGEFAGLLPVGTYMLGDHTFEVKAGHSVKLGLDKKGRLVKEVVSSARAVSSAP